MTCISNTVFSGLQGTQWSGGGEQTWAHGDRVKVDPLFDQPGVVRK